jgi:putative sigma-54 modulation protein
MQKRNIDPPIRITGRHVNLTNAMKEFVRRKIDRLHLQYPGIVEVHAILDRDL